MAYKSTPKALRLGLTTDWDYRGVGPIATYQLEEKVRGYLACLITFLLPPAPQRAKTKGGARREVPIQPGLAGRTLTLRSGGKLLLLLHFYLNYDGAEPAAVRAFEERLSALRWTLTQDTGLELELHPFNYYKLFWRLETFFGGGLRPWVRDKVQRAVEGSPTLRAQRAVVRPLYFTLKGVRAALRRWRGEQYARRSVAPMVAALCLSTFDGELLARAIAFELQLLRGQHARYLRFLTAFLRVWFARYNQGRVRGLELTLRGRVTPRRRQPPRTTQRVLRFGEKRKRAALHREGEFARALAFHRYGVISLTLSAELSARRPSRSALLPETTTPRGRAQLLAWLEGLSAQRQQPLRPETHGALLPAARALGALARAGRRQPLLGLRPVVLPIARRRRLR